MERIGASLSVAKRAGRTRDATIDARVLDVAGRHLALHGYQAMSLAAVAEEADTSRQALYRRWPNKAELAEAVVATMTDLGEAPGWSALVVVDFAASSNARSSLAWSMLTPTSTSP